MATEGLNNLTAQHQTPLIVEATFTTKEDQNEQSLLQCKESDNHFSILILVLLGFK